MRIAIGIGAELVGRPLLPAEVAQQACDAEAAGFGSAWTVHLSRGIDALSVLAVAGSRTSTIDLGVGVVPTYPRHPHALAQAAATVQSLCGGRLTLGVGVSHKPVVEGLFGLPYTSPAAHMREYLSVLVPLLREGSVTYRGEHFSVDGGFGVPGTSPVSVVVGGLGPLMVAAAGELADGTVTWLATPHGLASDIGPRLRASAEGAGRPSPRLVAAIPVAVCGDDDASRAAAREAAGTVFARYAGLENYQRLMARQSVEHVADVAVVGTEEDVARQLRAYADAGTTELWATPFGLGPAGAPDDGTSARTTAFLAGLAREGL
ncbi:TIGR03564 family F420-dependent LLM class oxidoreductase [Kineosporia sp. A_224]|uniref:TIGR03564 family F420-dependent LLM class oxidoreductase n=1 Tax=Kineosporia sp. A_224 TaxID=1962180 RepID=UPI000B4AB472|nr:TIGR03564 family F420-dependent LLM class oxidoreductase [Kineosporia sp. A_224]